DLYRTIENVSGRRLDWFWREWFLENPHFDQYVESVTTQQNGDTYSVKVTYGNKGRGVLPIHARFSFSDGTTADYNYPAEVWSTNTSEYVRIYNFPKKVVRIDLDPDHRLIDVDRSNNTWMAM